ncbi:hypothetical protein PI124_g15257 [Phytophthora idaei]|nr:hypothetical protein PI125_g15200 [Phytophthora idaei]KAG3144196.1 hypothetical protein PI126_g14276 [Phytophthora idaei]KAG3239811.1 hypothetical protein PI124_g15257 [Phytophthora idaei]
MAYEVVNAVSFGPITVHQLDIVNATRPDSAPFAVPNDNTTTQAMELDKQREQVMLRERQRVEQAEQDTATLRIKPNEQWVSVEVDRSSLWSAAGLPNHNVFAAAIFHAFSPPSSSSPGQQAVCHMQAEDDEESDDDQ